MHIFKDVCIYSSNLNGIHRNSVLLLNDENIMLEDICQYVLNTALSSTKVEVHDALASVLSQVACIASEKGKIIRYFLSTLCCNYKIMSEN